MALSQIVWKDGKIIPLEEATISIFSPSVQYAWKGFEGIRFYDTEMGPAVFRLSDHWERFFADTVKELEMTISYSREDLTGAIIQLIQGTGMREGYIRPTVFYPRPELGVHFQQQEASVAIALASWEKKSIADSVTLKISPVMRIHPKSLNVRAKISGHYPNSIRALHDAERSGFSDALLLDYEGNVAEASTTNIFMVKNWALYTPSLGSILPGITRETIITLMRDFGDGAREMEISPEELLASDEVFLCGTAMEILAVTEIDGKMIGDGKKGEVTSHISRLYSDVVHGRDARYLHWLTFVNS